MQCFGKLLFVENKMPATNTTVYNADFTFDAESLCITTAQQFVKDSTRLYVNGLRLKLNRDYKEDGKKIVFLSSIQSDELAGILFSRNSVYIKGRIVITLDFQQA